MMEDALLVVDESEPVETGEAALLEAARRDPAAFASLYRRYVTRVYRYLYKWVGNPVEAEDLTSQVFTEVLTGLVHYHEQGSFAAWLFTIARRVAIAAYRRRRPTLPLDALGDFPGPARDPLEQVSEVEQQERMAALFARLSEEQQDLLRLRFTACLSYAEIAALIGSSEAAIKMSVYRLLRQLYEKWETP